MVVKAQSSSSAIFKLQGTTSTAAVKSSQSNPASTAFASKSKSGLGKILVYYLYEQRLAILVNRAKINPFRWIIYALLLFYVGFVIAQVTVNMRDCYLTSTGSATVSSSASSICKYISNVLDICLGTTILFGSFYSLGLLMAENARAGIRSSGGYKLILTSDALRYLAVFPVEVYKMAVSSDASGSDMGFFPPGTGNGNNGFLQVINAYKIAAMIFLLVLPGMLVARSGLNPGSSNPDSKLASISSDSETQAPRMHDI
ncbi:hypothetical protein HK405_014879 [Cladochytrium tenue]|nr:hypothetical protein HK405_014879 [Cladochytrium tenue]